MKKLIVLVMAVAVMFCVSLVWAGPPWGWGHGMGPGYGWSCYDASNLNLTEEQSVKLRTLQAKYLKEITPLQNKMISLRSEVRLLWNVASPDRDKILAKQKELSELLGQLGEKATGYRLDYRAVLTPEQQSRLPAFGPGMGRGRGPGWTHGGRW